LTGAETTQRGCDAANSLRRGIISPFMTHCINIYDELAYCLVHAAGRGSGESGRVEEPKGDCGEANGGESGARSPIHQRLSILS